MLVRRARMAQIVSISHTLQKQHPSRVPNKTLSSTKLCNCTDGAFGEASDSDHLLWWESLH